MSAGDVLRLMMIIAGVGILSFTILSLAKKHMIESFCMFWGFIALLFIFAGIVLHPMGWNQFISWPALVIIFFGVVCLVVSGLFFSVRVSRLIRQALELAIQVSLLNQENEMLLNAVAKQNAQTEVAHGVAYEVVNQ